MVDVFFKKSKIFGIVIILLICVVVLFGCGKKDEAADAQSTATQSGSPESINDPKPSEDPSIMDSSTKAMETLLMLPEVMELFNDGKGIIDIQETTEIDGTECYLFGVGPMDDEGNVEIEVQYAVSVNSVNIWKQNESGDWGQVL